MKIRDNLLLKSMAILMVFMVAVPFSVLGETAKAESTQTRISFNAPSFVVPGKRITLYAEIKDPAGIKLVRYYFRTAGEADYFFVSMSKQAESVYVATLPAPASTSPSLDILVLAVNSLNIAVKTKAVTVAVNPDPATPTPDFQQVATEGSIQVSTELAQAPQMVSGFTDDVVVDVVESSARFLMVAYAGVTTGALATSGSAATTVTAGTASSTASASTSTIMAIKSTTFWWVFAGVGAAVIGGIAAAASGGGGGGGGSSAKSGGFTAHW